MQWEAKYQDGSVHSEAELKSTENVDRSQLKRFTLYRNGIAVFIAMFPQDGSRKLIFRRRTIISASGVIKGIVYLVGWHENVNGTSVKSICYVYDDGHIEFDGDRNDLELIAVEK